MIHIKDFFSKQCFFCGSNNFIFQSKKSILLDVQKFYFSYHCKMVNKTFLNKPMSKFFDRFGTLSAECADCKGSIIVLKYNVDKFNPKPAIIEYAYYPFDKINIRSLRGVLSSSTRGTKLEGILSGWQRTKEEHICDRFFHPKDLLNKLEALKELQ